MALKRWYYIDKDGNPAYINSAVKPPYEAYLIPKDEITGEHEDIAWLQIEDVDYDGTIVKEARVNTVLKEQILDERTQDQIDKDAAKQAEKDRKKALKDAVKNLKKSDIKDLKSIQDAILVLKDLLDDLSQGYE